MNDHTAIIKTAERVLELAKKATPEPWIVRGPSPGGSSMDDGGDFAIYTERNGRRGIIGEAFYKTGCGEYAPAAANADHIADSRTSCPQLAEAVIEMAAEIETLLDLLDTFQADCSNCEEDDRCNLCSAALAVLPQNPPPESLVAQAPATAEKT